MANQTSMSRAALLAGGAAPEGVVESLSEFANDVTTLADLQTKLAVHDTKEAIGRATWPAVFLVAAAAVALAGLFVLLLGLADLLAEFTKLLPGAAQAIVGVVSLAVAGITGYVAYRSIFHSLDSFQRSREELVRNLAWIKTVIVHSGRHGARRKV